MSQKVIRVTIEIGDYYTENNFTSLLSSQQELSADDLINAPFDDVLILRLLRQISDVQQLLIKELRKEQLEKHRN